VNPQNLTQVDIETDILRICDKLEQDTSLLAETSVQRAEAEATFKQRYAKAMVEQTGKVPVASKEAIAHLRSSDEFRIWRILEAREKATQQSLLALRARLDALRTISANVRAMT
jgi:hypothetical protein